ncbi:LuxR C-terminal-related transcriptional regulator [Streptosporangium amethystogenes]|uniref:LuxR C-terminal-related transcriptional regulator n=1 Tax=Streptosporangium amethystogenes TaxID=2002 RepID=UPI0037B06138
MKTIREHGAALAEARAGEAVLAERARLAREVHDILAHSQSAQIVHLEGARLLLERGDDPAALDRVERAVRLARTGLEETRRALDALRGEELPLAERLERLAVEFRSVTGAPCAVSVTGNLDSLEAIATVVEGQAQFDPGIQRRLAEAVTVNRRTPDLPDGLTRRESEVLRLIAAGRSNAEIAGELFVSEATVKTHINNLFAKAGLRGRAQAVTYAFRHGLGPD